MTVLDFARPLGIGRFCSAGIGVRLALLLLWVVAVAPSCLLPVDPDRDGQAAEFGDCDNTDPTTYTGAIEQCDGIDNDCDGVVPADEIDHDGDGMVGCGPPERRDCDDTDPSTYAGALEACDGVDNDCDGAPGPGEVDADHDNVLLCQGDCDDVDPSSGPGFPELCDQVDNDCDGAPEDPEADVDGDGFPICGDPADCDDSNPEIHPGGDEECNHVDDDCNGAIDDPISRFDTAFGGNGTRDCVDNDRDGVTEEQGDCDDLDRFTYPGAEEISDGRDNDCDGTVPDGELVDADGDGLSPPEDCDDLDSDILGPTTWYIDIDGDGHGVPNADYLVTACGQPPGYAEVADDCDDADPATYPGADDVCDLVDRNCDGQVEVMVTLWQDQDGDGYGNPEVSLVVCCFVDAGPEQFGRMTGPSATSAATTSCPATVAALSPLHQRHMKGEQTVNERISIFKSETAAGRQRLTRRTILSALLTAPLLMAAASADCDGDGYTAPDGNPPDCDDLDAATHPYAEELCDGEDNDCDGTTPVDEVDNDEDGFLICDNDCDDGDAGVHPGATETADGVDNDCDGLVDENFPADCVLWPSAAGGNNHCYLPVLVPEPGITWPDAFTSALGAGGYLATITSEQENAFVFNLISEPAYWRGPDGPWLGGYQLESSLEPDLGWVWATGESLDFSSWAQGQPDDHQGAQFYLHYWDNSAGWDDAGGPYSTNGVDRYLGYIIEYAMDPPPCYRWPSPAGGNDHCYRPVLEPEPGISWPDARDAAFETGGYLASVTSAEENAFVYALIAGAPYWRGPDGPWLGGYQLEASGEPDLGWTWVTGESMEYANWYQGQPDDSGGLQSYLHFWHQSPAWDDAGGPYVGNDEDRYLGFVVEFVLECSRVVFVSFENESEPHSLLTYCADDPGNLELMRRLSLSQGRPRRMELKDNRLYLSADGGGLYVYDISDPTYIELLGHWFDQEHASTLSVQVDDGVAFMGDYYDGVISLDVSDPTQITLLDVESSNGACYLLLDGQYIYGANCWNPTSVVDVSDPDNLTRSSAISLNGHKNGVAKQDDLLIVGAHDWPDDSGYLTTFDASSGDTLMMLGQLHFLDGEIGAVSIFGDYAYFSSTEGLRQVDISQPSMPTVSGGLDIGHMSFHLLFNDQIYAAVQQDGIHVVDVSDPTDIQVVGHRKIFGGTIQAMIVHQYP